MAENTKVLLRFKEGDDEYETREYDGAVPIPRVGDTVRLWAGIEHQMYDYVHGIIMAMEFDLVDHDEIVINYEVERFKGVIH